MTCTRCGRPFTAPRKGTGRPRSRCDACRSNQDRNDGVRWRELRRQVLAEEPVCAVVGCGRQSTQVDHIIPLNVRPDLGLVRSNLRGICGTCNARKGDRLTAPPPMPAPQPFRRWVL